MSNAMKYIKVLEAAGFDRHQAEAQVQMVLDVIEGDLATKSDIAFLKGEMNTLRSDLTVLESRIERRLVEAEFRIVTRLGILVVSTTSLALALLTWLIKI